MPTQPHRRVVPQQHRQVWCTAATRQGEPQCPFGSQHCDRVCCMGTGVEGRRGETDLSTTDLTILMPAQHGVLGHPPDPAAHTGHSGSHHRTALHQGMIWHPSHSPYSGGHTQPRASNRPCPRSSCRNHLHPVVGEEQLAGLDRIDINPSGLGILIGDPTGEAPWGSPPQAARSHTPSGPVWSHIPCSNGPRHPRSHRHTAVGRPAIQSIPPGPGPARSHRPRPCPLLTGGFWQGGQGPTDAPQAHPSPLNHRVPHVSTSSGIDPMHPHAIAGQASEIDARPDLGAHLMSDLECGLIGPADHHLFGARAELLPCHEHGGCGQAYTTANALARRRREPDLPREEVTAQRPPTATMVPSVSPTKTLPSATTGLVHGVAPSCSPQTSPPSSGSKRCRRPSALPT